MDSISSNEDNNSCHKLITNEVTIIAKVCNWIDNLLNLLNHILIFGVTSYMCWLISKSEKLNSLELHILFGTLGYQFFMAQGIIAFSNKCFWKFILRKIPIKHAHWVFGLTGFTLAITGFSLMVGSRKTHFTSPHGILGLTAAACLIPSIINGPLMFFLQTYNIRIKHNYMKIYHSITTLGGFCIGVGCLCTGYQKRWFTKQNSPELVTCFTVFSSLTIILTARKPLYNVVKIVMGMFVRRSLQ